MQCWIFSKMKGLGNRSPAESKAKVCILIVITAVCLFISCCSKKAAPELIGLNTGRLENLLDAIPDNALKVDILNELAYRASWKGGSRPLDYVNSAKELAENINYQKGVVESLCILGDIHFLNGEFKDSQICCRKGLALAMNIKYRTGRAMAYNGIGRYLQLKGEYAAALEKFLKSEEICKNSSNKRDKRVLARANYGLGSLYYYDPGDYQEAMKYFERYLRLGHEIKDDIIIASGYYAIGVQEQSMKRYKEAKVNFNNYLELSKKIGLTYNEANAYEGFGDVYFDQGKYQKTLENYEKSHELFLKTGNKFQVAEIKRRLGKLYNKMGERDNNRKYYEKAFEYLSEALKLAHDANIPKTSESIYEEIIKSCEKLGKNQDASNYYKLLLVKKEFFRANDMLRMKLILDYEKKAEKVRMTIIFFMVGFIGLSIVLAVVIRYSIILRKQKVQIEEQADILIAQTVKLAEALEKEKEISDHKDDLMHTVAHQYKTPLSIIDSSTQILTDYLPQLSKKEIDGHANKILSNIEKMTNLIDQLLKFGKKFTPAYYDLHTICRNFIEEIKSNEGIKHIIEFKSSGDCEKVKMDKELMNIMLSNLVVNSIKYSPEGSKIIVELQCDEKYAAIKVLDNGIGIPEDYLKIPFERFHRGSNVKNVPGTGLGLAIVKRYTELHSGDLSIESQLNSGTTVTIRIPRD